MSLKELKFVVHVKLYKYFTKIFAFQIKPVQGMNIIYTWNIHSKILNENFDRFCNENNDDEIDSIFNLVKP